MALVKCTECGKELSDKATTCPNCGCPLGEIQETEVTATSTKSATKKKTIIVMSIAILVVLAIIIGFLLYKSSSERKKAAEREAYIDSASEFSVTLIYAAAKCEDTGNLIKSIWYNTIFEEDDPATDPYTKWESISGSYFYDDFNEALKNFFSSDKYAEMEKMLMDDYEKLSDLSTQLKNSPEGLEDIAEAVSEAYSHYRKLYKNATSPSGSLETYSDDFSENDENTVDAYDDLENLLESYKEQINE